MISITRVRVTGFSRRFLDIDWEISPTHDDLQEWRFYVERSEAEAGPWDIISGPIIDRYYARDNTTPQISLNRLLFYRVRAVNQRSEKEIISPIADREGEPDLIAAEITALEHLLFTEFAGTRAWLFTCRTFGQRCPQCWDDVMAKRLDDACPVCFGTGFTGGYHYPIEFFAQFDPSPVAEAATTIDHYQQQLSTFRCPASPRVTPRSIIIDYRNRRYRVISVMNTARLGVALHQEVQILLLQPGSIEDAIELKVEHRTLAAAAYRNYSNPQCIEEAGGASPAELDTFLCRYGYEPS